ncbi:MAG: MFS transporter [Desulfobaccales bacterium]
MNEFLNDTFAALRHRNFRLFYAGQGISLTGSWMQAVALNWLALVLTDSAFFLGLMGALQTLPIFLFSFVGGVAADRYPKRSLLFATQGAMLLLAVALGILVDARLITVWLLGLLVFLSGSAMAFDIPIRQAFIVELVGKADLANAIALNSTLFNGTRVVGPALAGVCIAAVGMANCFYLNAVSFLAVLVALAVIRLPQADSPPRVSMAQAFRELKDFLRARPALRLVLLLMTLVSILGHPYYVLIPVLARDVLGAGPQGYGLLMAASGLGAFVGGLSLARRLRHRPPMPSFLGGTALFLAGVLALSLSRHLWLAVPAMAMTGFGMTTQLSTGNSLLQLNVPDHLRGRIMSLFGLIIIGSTPVGSLLYGGVAQHLGVQPTFALGSLTAGLAVALMLLKNPDLWNLGFSELAAADPEAR